MRIPEPGQRSKKILLEFSYILLVLPVLFLLVNRYPYLLIASVLLSIVTGLVYFIRIKAITDYHSEFLAILLIIFIYLILSYFFSGQTIKNFLSFDFLRYDGNFFFCYILFFVFSIAGLNYRRLAEYFFRFIFFTFTLFSLFGLIEFFFMEKSIMIYPEPGVGRIFFALNSAHNATGSVYAVVSIFLLVFFLKGKTLKIKAFYVILLLINIFALFLTKSRSSYLGFLFAAVIVIWLHFRSVKKFFITLGVLIAGAVPIVYFTGSFKRIINILPSESFTTVIRLFIWSKAWYLFSQSPVFGIGYGRFNDVFNIDRGFFDTERLRGLPGIVSIYLRDYFQFDTAHAHNSYLQFLVETGIIGLGLLMLFWIWIVIKVIRAYSISEDSFASKVLLCSAGSIFVLFALALFENYFSATTVMIPVSMIVPISIGLHWESSRKINMIKSRCNY